MDVVIGHRRGERSVEARVEDRQHFLQYLRRGLPDSPGFARPKVDRLDLFDHDESGDVLAFGDRHMKGVVAAGACDRTGNAKPRVFVEEVVADLPNLSADRRAPGEFFWFVLLRDTADKCPQVVPAPHAPKRCDDEGALVHGHVHRIPDVDVGVGQQILTQSKPLTSCGYPKYSRKGHRVNV
jgi:hypothetical protein